ncbi:hypothetical protein [Jeotgalibacillus proteolyticus]|uniref:Uncharacterized protein n=1 Tax=Jeotgalibacillus proteolyticus TaxID=2082395 RepID=A0A2S5GFV3_9BACL|nr:hypothetical protein [Jeotgalibacillus proteolyticus]PPA71912.1 hypothetical protein C4B60_00605 [Jeotgalibacillus proteolyticus]
MPKYEVIKDFTDQQDNNHVYRAARDNKPGDKFPRKGKVKKERIEELLSSENKRGEPLIKEVKEGDH